LTVVSARQAEDADKPEPKGEGYGQGSPVLLCAACDSPGGQADARSSQSDQAEHGKSVSLLIVIRGREPQGVPKGMRAKDVGESESRIAMMRITATPQPERAQTSDRWRITGKIMKGLTAVCTDRQRYTR